MKRTTGMTLAMPMRQQMNRITIYGMTRARSTHLRLRQNLPSDPKKERAKERAAREKEKAAREKEKEKVTTLLPLVLATAKRLQRDAGAIISKSEIENLSAA